ncbi:MAG: helix-turn-helix transcriptional regulator [Spirochaetaceae bacterium]|nr:helix-turn-helix transcriptional regulator [Spirochaetaceae bacterium]
MKKPHIEISAEKIPEKLLTFLKENYHNVELIDDDEEQIDISQAQWYLDIAKGRTPGATLKRYRKRAGMTQVDLGNRLGILKQNVSAMERGARGISKSTAYKLAEIFQTEPGRFI